jgi:hypothetical protein
MVGGDDQALERPTPTPDFSLRSILSLPMASMDLFAYHATVPRPPLPNETLPPGLDVGMVSSNAPLALIPHSKNHIGLLHEYNGSRRCRFHVVRHHLDLYECCQAGRG